MLSQLIFLFSVAHVLSYDPIVKCPINVLTYFSGYTLGRQHDLNKTFTVLQTLVKVPSFEYSPKAETHYTIEDMNINFFILNSKEQSEFTAMNHQRIHGAVLRFNYNFTWVKKVLEIKTKGNADGNSTSIQDLSSVILLILQNRLVLLTENHTNPYMKPRMFHLPTISLSLMFPHILKVTMKICL
jgi:hypothetical protein